jgi:glycosyltransferase involved in cell wall biosynthesis
MKISIITVSLNSEETIEKTIKSVISQEHVDKEFIIVDGKSKDDTLSILNKYKDNINIIISEKDAGIYDAINKGIKISSGDIVSLLHANDIYTTSKVLYEVNNFFLKNKNTDILLANSSYKKDFNDHTYTRYYSSKIFKPLMLRVGYSPPHLSSFFTKRSIIINGLYDKSYKIAGDFEYFVRGFLINKLTFKKLDKCFVNMSTGGTSGRNFNSYIISSLEINKALKQNGIYSNIFLTFFRFPIKIFQFFFK